MELRYLEEFVHLANSLNFTETANALHLTQPTLSKHMAMLESDLNAHLLERSSTNVELTEEGFYFLGVASLIISQLEDAQQALALMKSRSPIFIDGRFDDPAISSLVSLISSLGIDRGDPPVIFNHNRNKAPLTLLLDDDIDVLIDMPPAKNIEQWDLVLKPILVRPFVALMETDHPLASREQLTISDLKDYVLIQLLWDNYQPGWDKIESLCLESGFVPKRKPTPIRSAAEAITVFSKGCVLIFPSASKELKYLEKTAHRVCLPFSDADAEFVICATYKREHEEKLAPFLKALDEAVSAIKDDA